MNRSFPLVLTLGVLALSACGAEANYTLRLRPVVPLNQEPFKDGPHVFISVQDPEVDTEWFDLNTLSAGSGTVQSGGFGPLSNDRIAVALTVGEDPEDAPNDLIAFGASTPLTLGVGGAEADVGVLIAELDGAGGLTTLEQPAFGAAIAVLDSGRVYAFGGIRIQGGECERTVRRLSSLNEGEWTFERLNVELPEGVCYAQATVMQIEGKEMIVITGGEKSYNAHTSRSNRATVFDPETQSIVGTTTGTYSRARHAVGMLPDGNLLLVGAHQITSVGPNSATWEVLDPSGPTFGAYGTVESAPWDFMSAPLPGGLAICGGGQWVRDNITPLSACTTLMGDGSNTALPALPWQLRAGTMARLRDGRLVVAGGITDSGTAGSNLDGVKAAFILDLEADPLRWERLPDMNEARAYATGFADSQGGMVVIGGAEKAWGFGGSPTGVHECGERLIFEEGEARWELMSTCGEGGTGVNLGIGLHDGYGAVLLQGRAGSTGGGSSVAIVPRGPRY